MLVLFCWDNIWSAGAPGYSDGNDSKSKFLAGLVELRSLGGKTVPTGEGAKFFPGEDFRTSHAKDVGLFKGNGHLIDQCTCSVVYDYPAVS